MQGVPGEAPEMSGAEFVTSATTEKLDAALAKAQGEIEVASKDKVNPHFRSKYSDIKDIWQACRAALSKNGIAVSQWPIHSGDGRLHCITRLACSGEWMLARFSIPVSKDDAQGYGSAVTYIKRFALAAAVGVVASDEDDDGNAASEQAPKMAEGQLVDHLAALEGAASLDELQKAYVAAIKAAGRDQNASAQIIRAKDTMKANLSKAIA